MTEFHAKFPKFVQNVIVQQRQLGVVPKLVLGVQKYHCRLLYTFRKPSRCG